MKYGVSYYPEHRDEAEMDREIALMKEAGINVVRLSEFAWCRMEPEEGRFCFSWLDQAVRKLREAGIESIICTPTACPPAWMVEKHPEILYVDNRGVTRPFGGRRHYCYNNPVYREYSRRIAKEIGKHYGDNPFVIAFQIDNELAQEGTGRCHCDCCKEKFRQWLEEKYGTADNLNKKMGTIFWSQEYNHFGQINMPINTIETDAQEEGVFLAEDIAYKGTTMFSPKYLRKEFFPRLKRITQACHQAGWKFIFHSDGNLMNILDDLAEAGIDILNPLEVEAGMDIREIHRRYPDLILTGGIDVSVLLPFGKPSDVRDAVIKAIEDAEGKIMVGSSTEMHHGVPLENVLALYETALNYRF